MIEPDYGLLDVLLDKEQYDLIRCGTATVHQRTDRLLQFLTQNDVHLNALIDALQLTDQQHVVNFIQHDTGQLVELRRVELSISQLGGVTCHVRLPVT